MEVFETLQQHLDVQAYPLLSMLNAAITDDPAWRGKGPAFAIGVTSCIVVLLGHLFFSSPRSLKLVFSVLRLCAGHRRDNIRAIHPEMWRLLIWAFARIPITFDPQERPGNQSLRQDTRGPAFCVVRQELKHGIGTGLIDVLRRANGAGKQREEDVARVLGVVADLVKSDHVPSRDAGSAILCRLIASIGSPSLDRKHEGERRDVRFSRALIDGQLLSKSTREIRLTATETDTLIPELPPLSEEEVNHHWTPLSDIWVFVAQQRLDLGLDLTVSLIRDSWVLKLC